MTTGFRGYGRCRPIPPNERTRRMGPRFRGDDVLIEFLLREYALSFAHVLRLHSCEPTSRYPVYRGDQLPAKAPGGAPQWRGLLVCQNLRRTASFMSKPMIAGRKQSVERNN